MTARHKRADLVRVDKLLVDRGLIPSRDRASRLILAGQVWAGDRRIDKVATQVASTTDLQIRGDDIPYVSRGGLKLEAAIDHWHLDVSGLIAADIGASTGGFTDCLLQHGAKHVFAIDVGYGQFAWRLRNDSRVTLFERTNVRNFDAALLPRRVEIAVLDLSFISIRLVLPAILPCLEPGGLFFPLVKPQFEVGKASVGKGGVVRDETLRLEAVATIQKAAESVGFTCHGHFLSPVAGPKGNREYFLKLSL